MKIILIGAFLVSGPLGVKVVSTQFLLEATDISLRLARTSKKESDLLIFRGCRLGRTGLHDYRLASWNWRRTLNVLKLLPDTEGVVKATIPSEVSQTIVGKAINFANQLEVPVIGVVEK